MTRTYLLAFAALASLGAIVACADAPPADATTEAAIEGEDANAELPLVPFDDTATCTLMPRSAVAGELSCAGGSTDVSAFPTIAQGLVIRATTASGKSQQWSLPATGGAQPLTVPVGDLPVHVVATLPGAKYGADGVTTEYTIASLTNDANARRTLAVPFSAFRMYVLAPPGVDHIEYSARASDDVAPWTKDGASTISTTVSGTRAFTGGRAYVAVPVPARGADVRMTLTAGATKVEDVRIDRPGYYTIDGGTLRPARMSELAAANITDGEVTTLQLMKATNVKLCTKLASACHIESEQCLDKIGRLSADKRGVLLGGGACTSSCEGVSRCLDGLAP